jgi:hypothetical protein
VVEKPAAQGTCSYLMRMTRLNKGRTIAVDWKGLGYLVSIVSVLILGTVAWPKPDDPKWVMPALVAGMATSITGMGFRYIAHRQEQAELKRTKAEARRD